MGTITPQSYDSYVPGVGEGGKSPSGPREGGDCPHCPTAVYGPVRAWVRISLRESVHTKGRFVIAPLKFIQCLRPRVGITAPQRLSAARSATRTHSARCTCGTRIPAAATFFCSKAESITVLISFQYHCFVLLVQSSCECSTPMFVTLQSESSMHSVNVWRNKDPLTLLNARCAS